jgi:hypothetical protein
MSNLPSGWKIVPIEPTEKMIEAALRGMRGTRAGVQRKPRQEIAIIYDALLSAVPAQPALQSEPPMTAGQAAQPPCTNEFVKEGCEPFHEGISYRDLESMYLAQCQATDEFARKAEANGDTVLRARIAELEKALATMNGRYASLQSAAPASPEPGEPTRNVKEMVNRFLGWKLPKTFAPDAGISFKPTKPYDGDEYGNSWWPVGTNLFNAEEAKAMFEYCTAGAQPDENAEQWRHGVWNSVMYLLKRQGFFEDMTERAVKLFGIDLSKELRDVSVPPAPSRDQVLEEAARLLDVDADRQEAVWNAHIASGKPGPATSFHTIPRAYAASIRALKSNPKGEGTKP